MAKNKLIAPFVKWVGGKRQLIPDLKKHLPKKLSTMQYCEPFIGGGALFFSLQPKTAIINDYNSELINVYEVIKNNLDELIADLETHRNESDYYYHIRSLDREASFAEMTAVKKASRIIYLNKTCYNGLYRVNSAGEFNTPFGRYKHPNIVNEPVLRAVSKYLSENNIEICNTDYASILDKVEGNTFVYLDPPYHPLSSSSSFTGYVQGGWDESDQIRLRDACNLLTEKGVKFLLSNSSAEFIKDIYSDYKIRTVKATRAINSVAEKRGYVDELLIKNYG